MDPVKVLDYLGIGTYRIKYSSKEIQLGREGFFKIAGLFDDYAIALVQNLKQAGWCLVSNKALD